ncbi:MAG TPA: fimbrial protein [Scandinavium sp.]|jgi:type 1 fimbria pilin
MINNSRIPYLFQSIFLATLLIFPVISANAYIMAGYTSGTINNANASGVVTDRYPGSGMTQLMLTPAPSLQAAGVTFDFVEQDSSVIGDGGLFCKTGGGTNQMEFRSLLEPSGLKADGKDLFATPIPGIYYSLDIIDFRGTKDGSNTTFSPSTFPLPSTGTMTIDGTLNGGGKCNATGNTLLGGFNLHIKLTFYVDQQLDNARSGEDILPALIDAFEFKSADGSGSSITVRLQAQAKLTAPTCFATQVTSEIMNGSNTVVMGNDYDANELQQNNNPKAVPFHINLENCMGVKDIEVRLTSSNTDTDEVLLTNTYGQDYPGAAKGVGVLIEAQALSGALSILKPNSGQPFADTMESNENVHKYYPSCNDPALCDQGNDHMLNFNATLKSISGQTVEPGDFQAKGTFSITYR